MLILIVLIDHLMKVPMNSTKNTMPPNLSAVTATVVITQIENIKNNSNHLI